MPLLSARERVAIVEAGVTYAQLQPLLDAEGLRLCHPLLPPTGKSVVASQMDREPQLAPRHHWDFTDPMLCAELWFGTGDRFRTGSAAGPGATLEEQWRAGMFQKNPLGPAQTDLAKLAQGAQGSLGFATWVSLRLELRAELRRDLRVSSDDLGAVAGFLAAVTRRRLGEEILVVDRHHLARMAESLGVACTAPRATWTVMLTVGSLRRRPQESMDVQLHQIEDLAADAGLAIEDLTGTPARSCPGRRPRCRSCPRGWVTGSEPPPARAGSWRSSPPWIGRCPSSTTSEHAGAASCPRTRWPPTCNPSTRDAPATSS